MSSKEESKIRQHIDGTLDLDKNWYNVFNWGNEKLLHYRDFFKNKNKITDWDIRVNTIHSVKGAEADNVVIMMDITKHVDTNIQYNPDSEHRVFYVGVTRAKKKVYIVNSTSRYEYKIGE